MHAAAAAHTAAAAATAAVDTMLALNCLALPHIISRHLFMDNMPQSAAHAVMHE